MPPFIALYSAATSNGYPITSALEELDIPYDFKLISLEDQEQKSEWFIKINPNGRIPAIVDHKREGFFVFESSAILLYLAQHYDPERKISYDPIKEPNLYSEELQWILFAHGGLGPMQGQAAHFLRYAPEEFPYATKRYLDETKRLFSVVEQRLQGREWLVGPHYGLADMKASAWVRIGPWSGVELDAYPNIRAWIARISERPKTDKGLGVPNHFNLREHIGKQAQIRVATQQVFDFKKV